MAITMDKFTDRVFDTVRKIPEGKVTTYGQVAILSGSKGACRAVGNILHKNPAFGLNPCHRVVNAKGELAAAFVFGGKEIQKQLLLEEGIEFTEEYTVDLNKHFWIG